MSVAIPIFLSPIFLSAVGFGIAGLWYNMLLFPRHLLQPP